MPYPPHRPTLSGVRLTKAFGDGAQTRVALNEVSLDLRPGDITLLMGPSGSGKSTLLAVLSGLLPPDSGRVLAGDTDVWALSQKDREKYRLANVGFIFQGYNLFPALTARQQLELVLTWGANAPAREAREKADAMLGKLGLAALAGKKPAQLSGGEKQRVAIGRALVKDPAFLFADEPTSALDWENGRQVVALLRDAAHTRGASILVVSHDERMLPFVDACYHLEDGRLKVRNLAEVAR